ncbi:MAG TPA: hypothetical protein VKU84_03105, partial [Stellaceae bacterium]|nr:hypothetical protein [Stellaceae bacterium]
VSWAAVGFKGLTSYPKLLAADGRAFSGRTHSIAALLLGAGVGQASAELLTVVIALTVGALAAYRARRDDQTLFLIAVAVSLLASPMLEMHYLALLLIPLAIARPRLDALWLFAANIFWLSPHDPAHEWQVALVLLSVAILAARGVQKPASSRQAWVAGALERRITTLSRSA